MIISYDRDEIVSLIEKDLHEKGFTHRQINFADFFFDLNFGEYSNGVSFKSVEVTIPDKES